MFNTISSIMKDFSSKIKKLEALQEDRFSRIQINQNKITDLESQNEEFNAESQEAAAISNKLKEIVGGQ